MHAVPHAVPQVSPKVSGLDHVVREVLLAQARNPGGPVLQVGAAPGVRGWREGQAGEGQVAAGALRHATRQLCVQSI